MAELTVTLAVTFGLAFVAAFMEYHAAGPPFAKPPGEYQIHFTGVRVENHASLADVERMVQSADPRDKVRRIRALPVGRWFERITIGVTLATAAVGFGIVYVFVADPGGRLSLLWVLVPIGGLATVFLLTLAYRDADPDDERRLRYCTAWAIVIGALVLVAVVAFVAQQVLNEAPAAAGLASVLHVAS